ncbi:MAG: hypothetical protein JMDDDDMK_03340 [Acidobacteria bacterium]|nr:hypothetical protein [Acidobacteriota bacterium]
MAAQFTVSEELPDTHTYALTNITTNDIQVFIKSNHLTPQMKQALNGIADLKTQMSQLARQIAEKQSEINTIARDQERMRENLRALGKTEEERQLVQRYVAKISQGEHNLERLRLEEKKLKEVALQKKSLSPRFSLDKPRSQADIAHAIPVTSGNKQ